MKIKILTLLCVFVLTLQVALDERMANMSDTAKNVAGQAYNYAQGKSDDLMSNLSKSWSNFKNNIVRLFGYKHPKTGIPEDLEKYMEDFRAKIHQYFQKNLPDEDYSQLMDTFSEKVTEYIQKMGADKTQAKAFSDKFYDFANNITDFIHYGLYGHRRSEDRSIKDRLSSFVNNAGDYLKSNFTDFKEYLSSLIPGKKSGEETLPFVTYYHHHYVYTPDKQRNKACSEYQVDTCAHKCLEQGKVLCGCYKPKNFDKAKSPSIDCVCADSEPLCEIKHTHTSTPSTKKDEY